MSLPSTEIQRAGFATLLGAPNVGKSTLVNMLVGAKVSIVTHKVQTTRFAIRGIVHHQDAQIVLVDTPGVFKARKRLEKAMVQEAWAGIDGASIIVHVIDAKPWAAKFSGQTMSAYAMRALAYDQHVTQKLKALNVPCILALNKIDLFAHDLILPVIAAHIEQSVYKEIIPVSALNGEGLGVLREILAEAMPSGAALYDSESAADIPSRLLASEITREKLMLRLHQELPYQAHIVPELWEARKDGSVEIRQTILIGNKTHKPIVLGKGGQTLKAIGQAARKDIEEMLGKRVHLFLHVKVEPDWFTKYPIFRTT